MDLFHMGTRMKNSITEPGSPPPVDIPSFRAETRWVPMQAQLRRGRMSMLKEFKKPGNLTVTEFAKIGKLSPTQVYRDANRRRLLALPVRGRGLRIPDWQVLPIQRKLTRLLLQQAPTVDEWAIYYVLSERHRDLGGKSPIAVVTAGNWRGILSLVLAGLGFV